MVITRKDSIQTNEYYHILTKSIAGFIIFNSPEEFSRMIELLKFYQNRRPLLSFSEFERLSLQDKKVFLNKQKSNSSDKLIVIISYCIMPTHLHLSLNQLIDGGISLYMKNVLNSYTRYFNIKHQRKGPLWEARFKNVLVNDDKQLLHLTRYQHLNPVSANLVDKPENWRWSSYKEYLELTDPKNKICDFSKVMDINTKKYKNFVNDRIAYQKHLSRIKKLLLE